MVGAARRAARAFVPGAGPGAGPTRRWPQCGRLSSKMATASRRSPLVVVRLCDVGVLIHLDGGVSSWKVLHGERSGAGKEERLCSNCCECPFSGGPVNENASITNRPVLSLNTAIAGRPARQPSVTHIGDTSPNQARPRGVCAVLPLTRHWGGCGLCALGRRKGSRTHQRCVCVAWGNALQCSLARCSHIVSSSLRLRLHHGRRTSAHHLVPPTMRAARHARAIRSSRVPVPRRRRTFNHGRTTVEAVRTLVMPSRPCNVCLLRPPHPSSPTSHRPF